MSSSSSNNNNNNNNNNFLDFVKEVPEDAIFAVKRAFEADKDPNKLNLGIGAYRTEQGKPYVLKVVLKAEELILKETQSGKKNKEYLSIDGYEPLQNCALRLIFGENDNNLKEKKIACVQTLSGTGAVRLGFELIRKIYNESNKPLPEVFISNPTWGNHLKIARAAGFKVNKYRYYKKETKGLDFEGLIEDLNQAKEGSVILLQPSAHNPTGVDPTEKQWNLISETMQKKKLFCFFDSAYQGYATGNVEKDAYPIRLFSSLGFQMIHANSFSKNFGLYGERVGTCSVVCKTPDQAQAVKSQLKSIIRPMYSNPPKHGAFIVSTVLSSQDLRNQWFDELKIMSSRITKMRHQLYNELNRLQTPGDWSHIINQIGMFSYTGLNPDQVKQLTEKYHVYLSGSGRISVAGLSSKTVPYFANAVHQVVSSSSSKL